ncbi:MAG TPA: winged helix-turn-helix domain-containing protein [Nocardioidaceae bacterium]
MSSTPEPREARLDPRSVRVLAHPLRSRLLSRLRTEGSATATVLARALDTNTGATSYHLRKLAEVGLVLEEQGGAGRERWWRAAHEFTTLSLRDVIGDPDAEAAFTWLKDEYFQQFIEKAQRWAAAESEWSAEWREASGASDSMLELTPDELTAMQQEIWGVAERYRTRERARAEEGEDASADRRRVFFFMHCFPDTEESR